MLVGFQSTMNHQSVKSCQTIMSDEINQLEHRYGTEGFKTRQASKTSQVHDRKKLT